jgi:hypothetical protein
VNASGAPMGISKLVDKTHDYTTAESFVGEVAYGTY